MRVFIFVISRRLNNTEPVDKDPARTQRETLLGIEHPRIHYLMHCPSRSTGRGTISPKSMHRYKCIIGDPVTRTRKPRHKIKRQRRSRGHIHTDIGKRLGQIGNNEFFGVPRYHATNRLCVIRARSFGRSRELCSTSSPPKWARVRAPHAFSSIFEVPYSKNSAKGITSEPTATRPCPIRITLIDAA